MFEKSENDADNDTDDPDDTDEDGLLRYTYTRLGKLSTFTCVVLDDDIIPLNVQAQLTNAGTKMIFAIQPYRDGRQLRDSAGKVSCMTLPFTFGWHISGMEKRGVKRTHDSPSSSSSSMRVVEKRGVKRTHDSLSSSSSSMRVVTNLVESEDEEQLVNEKFC